MGRWSPLVVAAALAVLVGGMFWNTTRHSWGVVKGNETACPPAAALDYCVVRQPLAGRDTALAAFVPGGATLATAGGAAFFLWDVASGEQALQRVMAPQFNALSFAPDGGLLLAANGTALRFWDLDGDQVVKTVRSDSDLSPFGRVTVSSDGSLVAASDEMYLRVWGTADGEERHVLSSGRIQVRALAFSPDGGQLAVGRSNGPLEVYDVASGALVHTLPHPGVFALAYAPDGRLAAGGADGRIRVWDVARRTPLQTLDGHAFAVTALAYTPDGRVLVSGGRGGVRLWEAAAGRVTHALANDHYLSTLSVSSDGRLLAVAGMDEAVRVWRLP